MIESDFPKVIELNDAESTYLRRMMFSYLFAELCFSKAGQFDTRLNDITEDEYRITKVRLNSRMSESNIIPILTLVELYVIVRAFVHGFTAFSNQATEGVLRVLGDKLTALDPAISFVMPVRVHKVKGYTNDC